jgi:hypothetical protein
VMNPGVLLRAAERGRHAPPLQSASQQDAL